MSGPDVHCYQISLTIRGVPARGWGETLCGHVIEGWRGTEDQMRVVAPLEALAEPGRITCERCRELLPVLKRIVDADMRRRVLCAI